MTTYRIPRFIVLMTYFIIESIPVFIAHAQPPDWCWIKSQSENLIQAHPRNFDECRQWLQNKSQLDLTRMQAYNWKGTMIGMQCFEDARKLQSKVDRKAKEVTDAEIDYASKNPLIRYIAKQFNPYAPQRIVFSVADVGATVMLGGAPVAVGAVATTVGIGTTEETIGVLEQDGLISNKQAAQARLLLSVANALDAIGSADLSKAWSAVELSAYLGQVGIAVVEVSESYQGYQMTVAQAGETGKIEIRCRKL